MIPEWLRMPTLEQWEQKKQQPDFLDSRNVGLIDAVNAGWYQNDADELFRGFPVAADDVVVDVGCGAGGATLFCARRGAHVIYCDVNKRNIEQLSTLVRETPARASQGIVTDCSPLPLESNVASRVVSMEMLEHVDDPAAVLGELARIGRPGALYLISVPDAVTERMQIPFAPPEYFQRPNHIHIFERDELARLVSEAGLEVVERSSYGFFWNLWLCMYWICKKAVAGTPEQVSHDAAQPPYFPLLDAWTSVWGRLISLPDAAPLCKALDEALPRSQIVIARKPMAWSQGER